MIGLLSSSVCNCFPDPCGVRTWPGIIQMSKSRVNASYLFLRLVIIVIYDELVHTLHARMPGWVGVPPEEHARSMRP